MFVRFSTLERFANMDKNIIFGMEISAMYGTVKYYDRTVLVHT